MQNLKLIYSGDRHYDDDLETFRRSIRCPICSQQCLTSYSEKPISAHLLDSSVAAYDPINLLFKDIPDAEIYPGTPHSHFFNIDTCEHISPLAISPKKGAQTKGQMTYWELKAPTPEAKKADRLRQGLGL